MFNWFKKIAPTDKVMPETVIMKDSPSSLSDLNESIVLKDQGNVHLQNDDLEAAAYCYRRALALNQYYAESYNNLGYVLQLQGNPEEAIAHYRKALKFKPELLPAHQNLGFALLDLGQTDEAETSLLKVLELAPEHAEALQSLGAISAQRGNFVQAETLLRRALELQPDYAEAYNNLGILLKQTKRTYEAEVCYRRVLELQPDNTRAHYNLGNLLMDASCLSEAEACYRRALELKSDYIVAYCNLGVVLKDLGYPDKAMDSYRRALEIEPDHLQTLSNLLLDLNYDASHETSGYLEWARQFGQVATRKAGTRFAAWRCNERPKRLRVGMVSGDLRNHPVGFFLEALLSHINPSNIELIAYSTNPIEDELTERIKPCFAAWKPLFGLSNEAAANMIYDDAVHILIDLSGHTAHSGLPVFAWKPAPIQVSWPGYFASTGVLEIDYFIADPFTLPESEEVSFTEKIWRLPETRLCFTAPSVEIQVSSLPALINGYITFACFNNLAKMNDTVVKLWAKLLGALPSSRLFLKNNPLKEWSVQQSVLKHFIEHGIGADRLILEGPSPRADYLAAYNRVDIALDPFPFTGGTTSVESLWMGVPVLTMSGERLVARQGVGLLMNAGLSEWIASDADDYLARAVSHASDLPRLAVLRGELRQQVLASPLFDAPRFARHFEEALYGMWAKRSDERQN